MTTYTLTAATHRFRQFYELTKPRVVSLIVFCAVIGMFLASPADALVPLDVLFFGTLGIALVAGAAAAINCLVEQRIDAVMARTRARPLPRGELTSLQTFIFACAVGGTGLWLLYEFVNPLTMWLTLATFVGYAVIYTVLLKPATPQNIVIGGASGAMPPVLGWAAVTGQVNPEALLLFLIIFAWTPPHFWALALYRTEAAGYPRQALHPVASAAIHVHFDHLHAAAIHLWHERHAVSGQRTAAGRDVSWLCHRLVQALQRCAGAQDFPFFDRLPGADLCRLAGRSLLPHLRNCFAPPFSPVFAWRSLHAGKASRRFRTPISPAPNSARISTSQTITASRAR